MKNKPVFTAIMALTVVTLACTCNALSGLGGGGSESGALFEDDFADNGAGWDDASSDNGRVSLSGGEYVIEVFPTSWFVWANPEGTPLNVSNARIEVTARSVGAATEPGFGLMCHYQDGSNYYYMGVSTDGYYVIAKTVGGEDTVLSDPESWISSDSIPLNAASYRIRADCGNGTLALYVDNTQLASVSDSTFTSGNIGLFVQTFADANAEIHFDDVVVTDLAE